MGIMRICVFRPVKSDDLSPQKGETSFYQSARKIKRKQLSGTISTKAGISVGTQNFHRAVKKKETSCKIYSVAEETSSEEISIDSYLSLRRL